MVGAWGPRLKMAALQLTRFVIRLSLSLIIPLPGGGDLPKGEPEEQRLVTVTKDTTYLDHIAKQYCPKPGSCLEDGVSVPFAGGDNSMALVSPVTDVGLPALSAALVATSWFL